MSSRTSGTSASTGPSTGSPGATTVIGKTETADGAEPASARHPLICSADALHLENLGPWLGNDEARELDALSLSDLLLEPAVEVEEVAETPQVRVRRGTDVIQADMVGN